MELAVSGREGASREWVGVAGGQALAGIRLGQVGGQWGGHISPTVGTWPSAFLPEPVCHLVW